MKANLTNERFEGIQYVANTVGCTIDCVPNEIRERAYQIYEARGRQPGREWEDWFQAEREIKRHLGL